MSKNLSQLESYHLFYNELADTYNEIIDNNRDKIIISSGLITAILHLLSDVIDNVCSQSNELTQEQMIENIPDGIRSLRKAIEEKENEVMQ